MDIPSGSGVNSNLRETVKDRSNNLMTGCIYFDGEVLVDLGKRKRDDSQREEKFLPADQFRIGGNWSGQFPRVLNSDGGRNTRLIYLNSVKDLNQIVSEFEKNQFANFLKNMNNHDNSYKMIKWKSSGDSSGPCSFLSRDAFKAVSPATAFALYCYQTGGKASVDKFIEAGPWSLIPELLYIRAFRELDIGKISNRLLKLSAKLAEGFDRDSSEYLIPTVCFLSYSLSKKINVKNAEKNSYINGVLMDLLAEPELDKPEIAGVYYGIVRSSLLYAMYRIGEDMKKINGGAKKLGEVLSVGISAASFPGAGVVGAVSQVISSIGVKSYTNKYLIPSLDAYFQNIVLQFINSDSASNSSLTTDIHALQSPPQPPRADRFKKWYQATLDLSKIDMIISCKQFWNDKPLYPYIDDLAIENRGNLISICGSNT